MQFKTEHIIETQDNVNPAGLVFPSNLSMSLPGHSGIYSNRIN